MPPACSGFTRCLQRSELLADSAPVPFPCLGYVLSTACAQIMLMLSRRRCVYGFAAWGRHRLMISYVASVSMPVPRRVMLACAASFTLRSSIWWCGFRSRNRLGGWAYPVAHGM